MTDASARLVYLGESGALNEATSDIFAAMVQDQQPQSGEDRDLHDHRGGRP